MNTLKYKVNIKKISVIDFLIMRKQFMKNDMVYKIEHHSYNLDEKGLNTTVHFEKKKDAIAFKMEYT